MFSGGEVRFEKGQRIVVATSGYFKSLGEVRDVQGEGESALVVIKWEKKGKEESVRAQDLRQRLFDNRRNYWKLFEKEHQGWEEVRDAEVSLPPTPDGQDIIARIEADQDQLEILLDPEKQQTLYIQEQLTALRETKEILERELKNWRYVKKEEANNRFSTLYLGYHYWVTKGDFFHDGASLDLEELQDRRGLIAFVDQKIGLYEKALKKGGLPTFEEFLSLELEYFKKAQSDAGLLQAYAGLQSLYLSQHPEIIQTLFLRQLNERISRGVLGTPLSAVVTSDDLEIIEKDIEAYNLELRKEMAVGGGPKLSAGYGFIDLQKFRKEMGRLIEIENSSKVFGKLHAVRAKIASAVKELRKNPMPAGARVSFAIAKGAAQMMDEPSLAIMLVAGVGIAGPLSRRLLARLLAAGVPEWRARALALAFNGMLFHTATSTINFGLDQLPGANRGAHADFTPEGNLHAIVMMWWLGKMQKVYGKNFQEYLKFLKDQPALQKTLDVIGGKTFEVMGLASFNLSIGTAHHGLEALSPDNIYAELIESARFTIAYGLMHAGQHGGKKSPGREAFEIAQKNLREAIRSRRCNPKKLEHLLKLSNKAFEVMTREEREGLERELRLGRLNPKDIDRMIRRQQRIIKAMILRLQKTQDTPGILFFNLNDQLSVLEALRKENDPGNRVIAEMERRAERLKEGERPKRRFSKAASRKRMPRGSMVRRPNRGDEDYSIILREGFPEDYNATDELRRLIGERGEPKNEEAFCRLIKDVALKILGEGSDPQKAYLYESDVELLFKFINKYLASRFSTDTELSQIRQRLTDFQAEQRKPKDNGTAAVVQSQKTRTRELVARLRLPDDFAARLLIDNITSRRLLKSILKQWPDEDRGETKRLISDPMARLRGRIKSLSNHNLGDLLKDTFGQVMTYTRGGTEEEVAALANLAVIINKARRAGIEVPVEDQLWQEALRLTGRGKTHVGYSPPPTGRDPEAGSFTPFDIIATLAEGVRKLLGLGKKTERGLTYRATEKGLPLIFETDYDRLYNTDVRATSEEVATTFDFQGLVREDRTGYEPKTRYVDAMATNGILRGKNHPGIHVGTDGIVDYSRIEANQNMQQPGDVGEYIVFIKIPAELQREKKVVVAAEQCYSEPEYRRTHEVDQEETDRIRSIGNYIVLRLRLDPKEDSQAREKARAIHTALVHYLEEGGELSRIEELVRRLEDEVEYGKPVPPDFPALGASDGKSPRSALPGGPKRNPESGMAEVRVPKWAERLADGAARLVGAVAGAVGNQKFPVKTAGPGPDSRIPKVKLFAKAGKGNHTLSAKGHPSVTVGRGEKNTFSLEDPGISREHFKIEYRYTASGSKQVWVIEDLGSKNGTKVNGLKIRRPTVLQPGDKIEANGFVWIFGQEKSAGRGEKPPTGPVAEPALKTEETRTKKQEPKVQSQRDNPEAGRFFNPILVMKPTSEAGESSATTDPGRGGVEKGLTGNQDAVLMVEDAYGNRHLVAFDGMGGMGKEKEDGAHAARVAMEAYAEEIKKSGDPDKAYRAAHNAVVEFNRQKYKRDYGAGTVAVSVVVSSDRARFNWAGDAHGGLYREGEDGRLRLVYQTYDDDTESQRVHERHTPLNSDQFSKQNSVSNYVGNVLRPKVPGEIKLGYDEMVVHGTEDGLIPDPETEPGFRIADEFKEGVHLRKGDKIILASDGVFFWEDIPELIAELDKTEEIVAAIREESHTRMELFREASNKLRIEGVYEGGGLKRIPIRYEGKAQRLLELQKKGLLYINAEGDCFDAPTGGNKVAHFRMDHFSVVVYVHNPKPVEPKRPTVPLSDPQISRPTLQDGGELATDHFILRRERIGGKLLYTIEDTSEGETLVNGAKLEVGVHYLVREGDVIRVGQTEIVFNPPAVILSEGQRNALQSLTTWKEVKPESSRRLEGALLKEDPIEVLKALAEFPDIQMTSDWPGRASGNCVLFLHHRDHSFFRDILADLVKLALDQIKTEELPLSEKELKAIATRAGWVEGASSLRMPVKTGPSISQRLRSFGCPKPFDLFDSLKYILEHPRYKTEEVGKERLAVQFDPEYEGLILDLTVKLQTPSDMGQSLVNPQSLAVGVLLKEHGRKPDGTHTRFPKTEEFFRRHNLEWNSYVDPQAILDKLVFPDAEWNKDKDGRRFDPVGQEGYAEAVRELAEVVIPEFLEEPKIGMMGRRWFPFGKIELKQAAGIVGREIVRLLEGSKDKIEERLGRWKEEKDEVVEAEAQDGDEVYRGTEWLGYRIGVGGDKAAGTKALGAIKKGAVQGEDYWVWHMGKPFPKGIAKGRLYFAVHSAHAADFWKAFQEEVLEPASKEGKALQSKISNQEERLNASGDGAVLYFAKEDQEYFYERVVAFARRHESKGWFHPLEKGTRPIFSAQILDPWGNPVTGLSFGEDPHSSHESFNGKRAKAVVIALRQERLLDILGVLKNLSQDSRLQLRRALILRELERVGVDVENPAFNAGIGTELFSFIFAHTDQGFDRAGKTPAPPPAPPSPIEGLKGRLAAIRPVLEEDMSTSVLPDWVAIQAEFARMARPADGERELTLAELDALEATIGLEHLFELYSSRDPTKVVHEVLTKEFVDALAEYILLLQKENGVEGRAFKVRELKVGDGKLTLALQKRLAGRNIEIVASDSVEEADVILAERPYDKDKRDIALARLVEKNPDKTLILIGPESVALSPDFREQVFGRQVDPDLPPPKPSVKVQVAKPAGLNLVEGSDGRLHLLSRSDHRATTDAETSNVLVLRSSKGKLVPDMKPKKNSDGRRK